MRFVDATNTRPAADAVTATSVGNEYCSFGVPSAVLAPPPANTSTSYPRLGGACVTRPNTLFCVRLATKYRYRGGFGPGSCASQTSIAPAIVAAVNIFGPPGATAVADTARKLEKWRDWNETVFATRSNTYGLG